MNALAKLYQSDSDTISHADILSALRDVGVKQGDCLFVHSDIGVFGRLLSTDRRAFLDHICDLLLESVGFTGTIVMPTFTYSFCKGEQFDVENTKSTVGVLTEHFRKRPNVSRTRHPLFSVAVSGKDKAAFMDISHDSFDEDSIFGKLHQRHGKILFFGAPFLSCTYLHYIEQRHDIPYRFFKSFKGDVIEGDQVRQEEYQYFVRPLDQDVILDTTRLEAYLLNSGALREVCLGHGRLLLTTCDDLYNEGGSFLDQDIYGFLATPPLKETK